MWPQLLVLPVHRMVQNPNNMHPHYMQCYSWFIPQQTSYLNCTGYHGNVAMFQPLLWPLTYTIATIATHMQSICSVTPLLSHNIHNRNNCPFNTILCDFTLVFTSTFQAFSHATLSSLVESGHPTKMRKSWLIFSAGANKMHDHLNIWSSTLIPLSIFHILNCSETDHTNYLTLLPIMKPMSFVTSLLAFTAAAVASPIPIEETTVALDSVSTIPVPDFGDTVYCNNYYNTNCYYSGTGPGGPKEIKRATGESWEYNTQFCWY